MKRLRSITCCLLLILSGCSGQSIQPGTVQSNDAGAGYFTRSEHMAILPENVMISMKRSGGILPISREWLFYSDGRMQHPDGSISYPDAAISDRILNTARINTLTTSLQETYPAPEGSADYVTMELTLRTKKGIRKITAADSNSDIPELFWQFWEELEHEARFNPDK